MSAEYPYPYPHHPHPAPGPHAVQGQAFAPPGAHGYPGAYGNPGAPGGYAPGPGGAYQAQGGYAYPHAPQDPSFFGLTNERFLKGLLVGAAAAYLLTNDSVQRTAIKAVVKVWSVLQGGVEEIKERFHDAEAELRASEGAEGP
jgi:hypothetical protein